MRLRVAGGGEIEDLLVEVQTAPLPGGAPVVDVPAHHRRGGVGIADFDLLDDAAVVFGRVFGHVAGVHEAVERRHQELGDRLAGDDQRRVGGDLGQHRVEFDVEPAPLGEVPEVFFLRLHRVVEFLQVAFVGAYRGEAGQLGVEGHHRLVQVVEGD